jgi:hypothetical protein
MKPKEKAKELIELFTFNCRECDNSKISALIAVKEVIKEILSKTEFNLPSLMFWKEVKQEIENL